VQVILDTVQINDIETFKKYLSYPLFTSSNLKEFPQILLGCCSI